MKHLKRIEGCIRMKQRQEAIEYCLTLENTYEDYPFHDSNWAVIRHGMNKKMFACIFERQGYIWINVKGEPELLDLHRQMYTAVVPAFHMNKEHWNSIILDGTVAEEEICAMIVHSYMLTKPKIRIKKSTNN